MVFAKIRNWFARITRIRRGTCAAAQPACPANAITYGEGLRAWLDQRLESKMCPDAQFIGRIKNDRIVAVCGFSLYTGDDVELSLAADPGSGSRELLYWIFAYVFVQLQCSRCTARILEDNEPSRKLVERLGFVIEGRQRKAKDGKTKLLYGLIKEDLRYGKFTQRPEAGRS